MAGAILWLKGASGSYVAKEVSNDDPLPIALRARSSADGDTALIASPAGRLTVAQLSTAGLADNTQTGAQLQTATNDIASLPAVGTSLFNNTAWDRQRNNNEGTILASAARTATPAVSDVTNHNARGVKVFLNLTAFTAAASLTVAIQVKDSIGGLYHTILTSAAIVANGLVVLTVYPGIAAVANLAANEPLPRFWRATVTHGNANSHTYSLGYSHIL